MKNYLPILALVFFLGCQTPKENKSDQSSVVSKEIKIIEDGLHFFTFGDWGRNGHYNQKELADMMDIIGTKVEPEFIISTGDNFYPNGVASVNDPYWKTSFEDVYNGFSLFCPWYVVLGNHDYRGNYQAEIDYTQISRRWNMPSQYFFKDVEVDGVKTRFVFIDTSPLNDEYYEADEFEKYSKVHGQDTTAQLIWLDSVLNADVDWKIVVGHHPLYTGGKRVDDKSYVRTHIESILTKHKVDIYFAGHEHDLQYIKPTSQPTHHIISGAGSEVRPVGNMEYTKFAKSVQGFVMSTITADSIHHQFIDYKGNLLYSFSSK